MAMVAVSLILNLLHFSSHYSFDFFAFLPDCLDALLLVDRVLKLYFSDDVARHLPLLLLGERLWLRQRVFGARVLLAGSGLALARLRSRAAHVGRALSAGLFSLVWAAFSFLFFFKDAAMVVKDGFGLHLVC